MDSTPVLIVNRARLGHNQDRVPPDCLVVALSDLELVRLFRLMGLDDLRRLKRLTNRARPVTSAIRDRRRLGDDVPRGMLTQRERQILALQQRGESNKDIAVTLGIGIQTVKNHLHHIRVKVELCGQQANTGARLSKSKESGS